MSKKNHKAPVGAASTLVSPPLGSAPMNPPATPPTGPEFQLPPPEVPPHVIHPQSDPVGGIPMTDGTPVACHQKNAADFLAGDVQTSVMAHYAQGLFSTQQHTYSEHPAPDEDPAAVKELAEWRENAPYG